MGRGRVLDRHVWRWQVNFLPEVDKYDRTKVECYASIDTAMGGKAAEELIFGPENVWLLSVLLLLMFSCHISGASRFSDPRGDLRTPHAAI